MKLSKASAYGLHALMFMVRHLTQLPISVGTIAKAEGIPMGYLAKIFPQLAKAGLIKAVKGRQRGYTFAKPPEEITLLDLFEVIEGEPLFEDCLLRHCDCGGTPESCEIYGQWYALTRKMTQVLRDATLMSATWGHPEHRFCNLSESLGHLDVNEDPLTQDLQRR